MGSLGLVDGFAVSGSPTKSAVGWDPLGLTGVVWGKLGWFCGKLGWFGSDQVGG